MRACVVFVLGAFIAGASHASDGVIEVNLKQEGSPPATPRASPSRSVGSYRLTSGLDVPAGVSGFEVQVEDVTLDLGGWTVRGTTACTVGSVGYVSSCNVHQGHGITNAFSFGPGRMTVRNGVLRGFDRCIFLAHEGRVEDVRVSHCSDIGIVVGIDSQITRVVATHSLRGGVNGEGGTHVSNLVVSRNSQFGLELARGGQAIGVSARNNLGGSDSSALRFHSLPWIKVASKASTPQAALS